MIKSVNRYLSKHGRDYATETLLIRNIRKLSKNILPEEQQQIFKNLQEELSEAFKDHHEQVILEYFNLTAWVESKLNKHSYAEEVVRLLKTD